MCLNCIHTFIIFSSLYITATAGVIKVENLNKLLGLTFIFKVKENSKNLLNYHEMIKLTDVKTYHLKHLTQFIVNGQRDTLCHRRSESVRLANN